jgi:hypothetical protein
MANTTIDYIIGLPPGNLTDETMQGRTQTVMENSMPLVKIYPGIPSFTRGLNLFKRAPAYRMEETGGSKKTLSYLNMLQAHKFDLAQPGAPNTGNEGCLVLAYQADSFPSDSFSNEYGENFLQGITNVGSDAASSLAQIRGGRDAGEVFDSATGEIKGMGQFGNIAGTLLQKGGAAAAALMKNLLPASVMGGIDVVSKLMAGSRIDFPMVWKGSSFQPSYTMTIRLYNPNPGSEASTRKYIAAPIAAIMLLGIPISSDGITYSWPFIHKIVSPGIYHLDPAFISNITVIKGGDQQQIAYTQRLGIVDIRIDFGSLFSSMLADQKRSRTRPTLTTYLSSSINTGGNDTETYKSGVENFSTTLQGQLENTRRRRAIEELAITKNQAPVQTELTEEEKNDPPDRVSATTKAKETHLLGKLSEGFKSAFGL